MGLIYIAQPYSHEDHAVEVMRFHAGCKFVAEAIRQGFHVFNPIVHCHPVAVEHDLPGDARFWKSYNETFLAAAGELWILTLPGWLESKGIQQEIEYWDRDKRLYSRYCRMVSWNQFEMDGSIRLEELPR